jgi:hypothetical protein
LEDLSEDFILQELSRRKGFIKGVVITGGDPLFGEKGLSIL